MNKQPEDEASRRLEQVVKECCEALDHLRRAVDHADGADPFMLKLVATMRRVASLADDVIAAQDGEPPPETGDPAATTRRSA